MKRFILLLLVTMSICNACYQSPTQAQTVQISGKIVESVSIKEGDKFVQSKIVFYLDDLLRNQKYEISPDKFGNFQLQIPLLQPTPAYFEYDGKKAQMFLSPGEIVKINFSNSQFDNSLKFDGGGKLHNTYCAEYRKKFNNDNIDYDLSQRRTIMSAPTFSSHCQSLRLKENAFLRNFLAQNPEVSIAFKVWAQSAIEYRTANRTTSYFYKTADKFNDSYIDFALQFSLTNPEALVASEYLKFLENHLRHLCMRDPLQMQKQREDRGEPWLVRASQIAPKAFNGKVLDHIQAHLALVLIDVESSYANGLYDNFMRTGQSMELKELLKRRFNKYSTEMNNIKAPANARMFIVNQESPLTFEQLLSQYKGKVVYLDFWASWCKPCMEQMTHAPQLKEYFKEQDVAFVYLSSDDSDGQWKKNIARLQVGGDHYLMDENLKDSAYTKLLVTGLPRYVIIDREGEIADGDAKRPNNIALRYDISRILDKTDSAEK
ncbi:MAG: TlpA family protein disulfide reductase [Chitinophagales bacterium]